MLGEKIVCTSSVVALSVILTGYRLFNISSKLLLPDIKREDIG
jgi:hypothetical protein